ncbi:hypothetical protein KA107_00150 [Candidatus Pacearchaeota archaeon]|nr:hypothetical protein [Candidatus Pacearchaeota archaeon]
MVLKYNTYFRINLPRVCVNDSKNPQHLENINLDRIRYENGKYSLRIWPIGGESYFYHEPLSLDEARDLHGRINSDSLVQEVEVSLLKKDLFRFEN